jgi:DNA-nicking Smr family endonuclease
MNRRLTPEERELWERLGRTVRPLRRKGIRRNSDRSTIRAAAGTEAAAATISAPAAPATQPARKAARPAAYAPTPTEFDEKTRRRLARGLVGIDARIDLHGMRQERAFAALASFLKHAQARGQRIVLVITGKGAGAGGEGRGVLKHAVPAWLAGPDFRELVTGFEEAGRRHGGAGALYVRIRRRRAPARAG